MGRYSNSYQGINEHSTVPPHYQYPWTANPMHHRDHGFYDKSKDKSEKEDMDLMIGRIVHNVEDMAEVAAKKVSLFLSLSQLYFV